MRGYYYSGHTYVSAAEKRAKAQKQLEKLRKTKPDIEPVVVSGRKIAKTWWGRAWVDNLASYADYSNRLSRGSSYVTGGMVLDLKISEGCIDAIVAGSAGKPYSVTIQIQSLAERSWRAITAVCGQRIANIDLLIEGKFPEELEALFTQKGKGLFPTPKEISFSCSCPDWASMCKHVAAVMYATGARLDENPLLFFTLRNADFKELLKKSVDERVEAMLKNYGKKTKRVMAEEEIGNIFHI